MVRHCRGRRELFDRIRAGEIGDMIALRAYRMAGRSAAAGPNKSDMSDVLYQIRNFHSFLWASGGVFSDYYIHQIDECSWMKDAWPVDARACGGRHYRDGAVDQNLDNYCVEYTYPDGAKLFYYGRNMTGCHDEFASFAHGSKGGAIISTGFPYAGPCPDVQRPELPGSDLGLPAAGTEPYQMEWEDLVDAIRDDTAYNEVKRGATASLVTSMGRMAAHTGQIITFDQMLNCEHEFAPEVAQLSMGGPAPIKANSQGEYPVPMPGILTDREYEYKV